MLRPFFNINWWKFHSCVCMASFSLKKPPNLVKKEQSNAKKEISNFWWGSFHYITYVSIIWKETHMNGSSICSISYIWRSALWHIKKLCCSAFRCMEGKIKKSLKPKEDAEASKNMMARNLLRKSIKIGNKKKWENSAF